MRLGSLEMYETRFDSNFSHALHDINLRFLVTQIKSVPQWCHASRAHTELNDRKSGIQS